MLSEKIRADLNGIEVYDTYEDGYKQLHNNIKYVCSRYGLEANCSDFSLIRIYKDNNLVGNAKESYEACFINGKELYKFTLKLLIDSDDNMRCMICHEPIDYQGLDGFCESCYFLNQ